MIVALTIRSLGIAPKTCMVCTVHVFEELDLEIQERTTKTCPWSLLKFCRGDVVTFGSSSVASTASGTHFPRNSFNAFLCFLIAKN